MYLGVEELTGDRVGFVEPGLVLLTGDGHLLYSNLRGGLTDRNYQRLPFTNSETLVVTLQAAGVTDKAVLAVLAGGGTVRSLLLGPGLRELVPDPRELLGDAGVLRVS